LREKLRATVNFFAPDGSVRRGSLAFRTVHAGRALALQRAEVPAMRLLQTSAILVFIGIITVGCGSKSPAQPTPSCEPTLSSTSASYGAEGGSGSVGLSIAAGCAWTVTADSSWVAVSGTASGSGPATIGYTVGSNTSTGRRTAKLSVAGQSHAIAQEGRVAQSCAYELSPAEFRTGKDAVNGTFTVTTAQGCTWSASSNSSWLSLIDGTQGTGNGVVSYGVSRNPTIDDRVGTIAVGNAAFTVTQLGDSGGCQYSVAPVTLNACMASGTVASVITTQANCTWSASTDVPWMNIAGSASGSGSATITVQFPDNYDLPRAGTLMIRWPTPTAGQNVRFSQAGCRYGVSKTSLAFTAAGGTGTFDVLQESDPLECGGATQDRCVWSAISGVGWITITSSMPRAGDNPVSFTVAANPSATPRTGTITVRDKTVVITQSGQ
jgi:hypothetical protein